MSKCNDVLFAAPPKCRIFNIHSRNWLSMIVGSLKIVGRTREKSMIVGSLEFMMPLIPSPLTLPMPTFPTSPLLPLSPCSCLSSTYLSFAIFILLNNLFQFLLCIKCCRRHGCNAQYNAYHNGSDPKSYTATTFFARTLH